MTVMKKAIRPILAAVLFSLFFGLSGLGCVLSQSTNGTGISEEQVGAIVVGSSTRADVANVFGAPDEIIYSNLAHDPLFERAYKYSRRRRKTTFFTVILFSGARSDVNHDQVIVFFDDFGLVEDVAARLDMDRPRYGVPWGDDDK
jgi:outer membrane protein assembly factor BamE (lipoprotein component of BamABCDE complex)